MSLQKDRRRINVKGGGILQVREIDPGSGTFADIGFIKDSSFIDEYGMVESVDDKGDYIDTKPGSHKASWKTTLMQTSKEEIDLMTGAVGKYYELYYKAPLNNSQIQEVVAPVCRIKPGATLEFKAGTERNIAIEVSFLAPATALTRTPTAYNTVAWQPYIMTEGSVANGAPSDAVTVPRAAI